MGGFIYLVAIMDWFSRYVVSWEVSVSQDTSFCVSALDWALARDQPEIFNSDQGGQFTSEAFTNRLKDKGIHISMDGRGRVMDNIFVERLWRTVKYEEVYLKDYRTVEEAVSNLRRYFDFYNQLLQPAALSSGAGLSDPGGGLLCQIGTTGEPPLRGLSRIGARFAACYARP